jgi:hypothetical protein
MSKGLTVNPQVKTRARKIGVVAITMLTAIPKAAFRIIECPGFKIPPLPYINKKAAEKHEWSED